MSKNRIGMIKRNDKFYKKKKKIKEKNKHVKINIKRNAKRNFLKY